MVGGLDRRLAARCAPARAAVAHVRIRAGGEAAVIDYSAGGVRLSSPTRLLPGQRCVLAWPALPGGPHHGGLVVRCAVSKLVPGEGVVYEAAVRLDSQPSFMREASFHGE